MAMRLYRCYFGSAQLLLGLMIINGCDYEQLYLYHGNLFPGEKQFKDRRFVGLCLGEPKHDREIQCDLNAPIPLPDNCADAFQSQDVIEHISPANVVCALNEIYRVVKPGGFIRISVPDYNSPFLMKRCVFDHLGNIYGDLACGTKVSTTDLNSGVQATFTLAAGANHLWFPTIEILSTLIKFSQLGNSRSIDFIHANYSPRLGKKPILSTLREQETFFVQRCPPHDMRADGLPVSLILDIVK